MALECTADRNHRITPLPNLFRELCTPASCPGCQGLGVTATATTAAGGAGGAGVCSGQPCPEPCLAEAYDLGDKVHMNRRYLGALGKSLGAVVSWAA